MKTKKYFLRKLTAAVLAGILAGSSAYVPAYAEKSTQSESAEEYDRNELLKAVVEASYVGLSRFDQLLWDEKHTDYNTWSITDIYPVYDVDKPQEKQISHYTCYLLKNGKAVSKVSFSTAEAFTFEHDSFPLIDEALLTGKSVAFAVDQDGGYLITEDSVELLGQYYCGIVSDTPLEGKDFSVYHSCLSSLRFIRFSDYRSHRSEYRKNQKSFTFYQFGWNEFDGERYYLKKDGTLATGSLTVGGIRYKFDENGVCQGKYTGFTESSKGKRYWKNGKLVKNKWIKVKGEWKYFAGADGYCVTENFPKIGVEFPDEAVYESTDGGKSWTKNKEAQTPIYARCEGEYPVRPSEAIVIELGYNLSFISFGKGRLYREENGEWKSVKLPAESIAFIDSEYEVGENEKMRFPTAFSFRVPLEGKYRYTLELGDIKRNQYMVSVEFWVVE